VTLCRPAQTTSTSDNSSNIAKTFQTVKIGPIVAWRLLLQKRARRGACSSNVCASLCESYPAHETDDNAQSCHCQASASATTGTSTNTTNTNTTTATTNTNSTTPTTSTDVKCGTNAYLVNASCRCKSGFEGNATVGCTDINECRSIPFQSNAVSIPPPPPCAFNQECINTLGSYTCQPRSCANEWGSNPCGPASACTDAPNGFACTPLYNATYICPAACPTTETCVPGGNATTFASCRCKPGYHRPTAFLPCVAL
jgi:hypothetical protein